MNSPDFRSKSTRDDFGYKEPKQREKNSSKISFRIGTNETLT